LNTLFDQKEIPQGDKAKQTDQQRLLLSMVYPAIFIAVIWLVKIVELLLDVRFTNLGILPQQIRGLPGILLAPFIHSDFSHLVSNSLPLFILGSMLFYFYRSIAFKVFMLSLLITGFWVWVLARDAWHIGASGVVYSLAAFLFTSGVIRKHPRLMATSLIIAFLYGGMVWGIFPLREHISWESHLLGMLSGLLLAIYFKAHGPQRKLYSWEIEEIEQQQIQENQQQTDDDDEPSVSRNPAIQNGNGKTNYSDGALKVHYIYKPGPGKEDDEKK
jgi:membrane associated rhomboid family serine protease